jgi:predicted RNA-binding protein YlxR (DUF448 family)
MKQPERTCIACRKKDDKSLFLKIVSNKNGEVHLERDVKLEGRGAYICNNENCAALSKKNRSLNRVFKKNISDEVYEEILNEFRN